MSKKKNPTATKTVKEMTVPELRKEIELLTARVPVSHGERYLRRRLADLRTRASSGEDIRHRADSTTIGFSAPLPAKEALDAIIDEQKSRLVRGEDAPASTMTKLCRIALREWCERNGHDEAADYLGGE